MKKILSVLVMALAAMPTLSQTEFRKLSHDEAIATAKAEGKLVFIDFYTTWCGPCKAMARDIFPQPKVGDYFNQRFVSIQLDAEKEDEGKPYRERYEVPGFPTFVILDPNNGEMVGKIVGGVLDADKFIERMELAVDKEMSPQRVTERYQSGERTPKLVKEYVHNLVTAMHGKVTDYTHSEASAVLYDYWKNLPEEQKRSIDNLFCYEAHYLYGLDDPIIVYMHQNREDFEGEMKEKIQGILANAYNSQMLALLAGRTPCTPEAVALLRQRIGECSFINNSYDSSFAVLDAMSKGNPTEYLDVVEQQMGKLGLSQKSFILSGIPAAVNTSDPAVINRAISIVKGAFSSEEDLRIMQRNIDRYVSQLEEKLK